MVHAFMRGWPPADRELLGELLNPFNHDLEMQNLETNDTVSNHRGAEKRVS